MKFKTDEQLMLLYQNGEIAAFDELFKRHSSKVYGFLLKRVRNDQTAADLSQEAFVKLHKSKHLYNPSLPVPPWIFSVTNSVLLDFLKKRSEVLTDDGQIESLVDGTPLVALSTIEVEPMIEQLPNPQREAVHMRYIDEQSFEAISVALKTSPDNARKIVSRGIKNLKSFLNGDGHEK
ncbi:hypothetical protein CIK05_11010 [Bdellovibrio sp. qaytius]|nr:hypothetical protein CIK05_11010 [Bdellovibrio sp. qaytius]